MLINTVNIFHLKGTFQTVTLIDTNPVFDEEYIIWMFFTIHQDYVWGLEKEKPPLDNFVTSIVSRTIFCLLLLLALIISSITLCEEMQLAAQKKKGYER